MESNPKENLITTTKRSFISRLCNCACFKPHHTDSEDYNLNPFDSSTSSSAQEPEVYSIKNFSADKIYFLGNESQKTLCVFKHMAIESLEDHKSIGEKPTEIEEELWRQRYRIFSKYDQGVKLDTDS